MSQTPSGAKTYTGGCHCGAVRFEADIDFGQGANRCNCSICTKLGRTNVIIKPAAFRLVSGQDSLTDYHRDGSPVYLPFCKVCGVHAFGRGDIPELGGAYFSVNTNCLDDADLTGVPIHYWDGRHNNWNAGPRSEPWPVHA